MDFLEEKLIKQRFIEVIVVLVFISGYINIYLLNIEKVPNEVTMNNEEKIDAKYLPVPYNDEIIKYSESYGLDPYLVAAIIKTESGFDKDSTSSMGAVGLMQIMPSTGEWIATKLGIDNFTIEMLKDDELNINMGCWYLSYLENKFKYRNETLAAYNGGMGNVFTWLNDSRYSDNGEIIHTIPFKETVVYIEKVVVTYNNYIDLYVKGE